MVAYTTVRNWMEKDFPRVFKMLGGGETGSGGLRDRAGDRGPAHAASEGIRTALVASKGVTDRHQRGNLIAQKSGEGASGDS